MQLSMQVGVKDAAKGSADGVTHGQHVGSRAQKGKAGSNDTFICLLH